MSRLQSVYLHVIARDITLVPQEVEIWWRHDIEKRFAFLCDKNPSVTAGFPSQRASDDSFDVYFMIA